MVGPLSGAPGQTGLARELRPHLASLVSGLDKARFARLVQAVEGLEEAQCLELVRCGTRAAGGGGGGGGELTSEGVNAQVGGIVMSPAVLRAVSTNESGYVCAPIPRLTPAARFAAACSSPGC